MADLVVTKRHLARRALIAVPIGLIGAWLAFALAISGITRRVNPETALKFMSGEALALAARADQLQVASGAKLSPAVHRLALQALREQPLNPRALRVLGYHESLANRAEAARAYITMAERQSRREGAAQLWLIEDAVGRGDVKGALRHYDIALRTKPSTYVLLFPILVSALDDPVIRGALKPYMRSDRSWVQAFLIHANANSSNLPALVSLWVETGGFGDTAISQRLTLELLTRLVSEKQFAESRRLYLTMSGSRAAALTDPGFSPADREGRFGPMGWQIVTNPESGANFAIDDRERTVMSVYANAGTLARVGTKLLYLKPGKFDFSAGQVGTGTGGGLVRWQLRCPMTSGDQPVWTVESLNAGARADLPIPPGCDVQFLDIIAVGGSGQNGLETSIAAPTLRRRN